MSKYNEAQKRAAMKYMAANTETITLRIPKGTKAVWLSVAAARGVSFTRYVTDLITRDMSCVDVSETQKDTKSAFDADV